MAEIFDLFPDKKQMLASRGAVDLLERFNEAETAFYASCKEAKLSGPKARECMAPFREVVKDIALKVIGMEARMKEMDAELRSKEGEDYTQSLKEVLVTTAERLLALEEKVDRVAQTPAAGTVALDRPTYAGTLRGRKGRSDLAAQRGSDKQEIPSKTLIVVKTRSEAPEDADAAKIKETVRRMVKPEEKGWQIVGMRSRRGKEVVIEAADKDEARKIMADTDLGASGLEAELMKKRRPAVLIRGVPGQMGGEDITNETLLQALWKQNFAEKDDGDLKRQITVIRKIPWKRREGSAQMWNVIVEADPEIRQKLCTKGHVYLSWYRCGVEDHIDVLRCFRCGIIGHSARNCRNCAEDEKCCRVCMEKTHIQRECPNKKQPVCGSCRENGDNHNHMTGTAICEAHRRAVAGLLGITDYGL